MILDSYKAKLEGREEIDEELQILVDKLLELGVGKTPAPQSKSGSGMAGKFGMGGRSSGGGGVGGGGMSFGRTSSTRASVGGATGGGGKAAPKLAVDFNDYVDPELSGSNEWMDGWMVGAEWVLV